MNDLPSGTNQRGWTREKKQLTLVGLLSTKQCQLQARGMPSSVDGFGKDKIQDQLQSLCTSTKHDVDGWSGGRPDTIKYTK
jgi:hypothetical protein